IQLSLMVLLLFLGGIAKLPAQRYFTKTYTEADGLLSSMVFDVVQDSAGHLWFATRTGISCYTGTKFINYNQNSGLRTSTYAYLVVDNKGELWTLPQNGEPCILKFTGTRWEPFACDTSLKITGYFSAFDVTVLDEQVFAAIGMYKTGVLIYQEGKWKQYTTDDGMPSDLINDLVTTINGVYVATENGLAVIQKGVVTHDLNNISPYLKRNILAMDVAPSSWEKSDTAIWLLGENWLGYLFEGSFHLVTTDFTLPVKDVGKQCFLEVNRNGDICFGNPIYVYTYSEQTGEIEIYTRNSGLITNGGTEALTDREGNLWITGFRGITKIPSRRFQQYSDNDGLYSNEVASSVEYSPGKYLFGHHGAVTFYDGTRFTPFKLPIPSGKSEFETRVQDVDVDPAGNLWMAVSASGVARLDKNRKLTWYNEKDGLTGTVNSVFVSSDGKIYAGTNNGLYQFSNGRFIKLAVTNEVINTGVRKIFKGPGKDIYLSTYSRGIISYSKESIGLISSLDNPLDNNVYAVFFDNQERGWAGSATGLFAINDTMLIKYDSGGLVIDRPIYLILQDHNGYLWFGTDNGAYRYNGETLDHFTINDGFSGLEVNRDAGFEDHSNHIWFGTNNGITKYNPEFDYNLNSIPAPIIKLQFIETDKDTLSPFENVSLSSRDNNLFFHFDITSYIDETQVMYQCKLDGLDNDWSQETFAQNNVYRYNNLAPGTYRFCIKAKNSLGIWSDPVCSGTIRIKQPFWFQWWFILAVALFISSLLFILTRLFVVRRYNLRLSKMVAIRTRELKRSEKDLKESNQAKDNFFSIIAHDLKSPFNAILGMLELLTTEYDDFTDKERHKILMSLRTASTRTIDLLENLLTWAQAQKGLLPFVPEKFDLMELVRENFSLFEPTALIKRIRMNAPLSENVIVYGDRNMINTVVRNLISNAIKFTYPDGDVTIKVGKDSGQKLTVAIIDNGCGMKESAIENLFILDKRVTTKGTNDETGTGLGLILSKDFIAKNKGKIWVESKLESGTTFYFTLPTNPPEKRKSK
ncbi:ATP-binding protein, partial [Bacteroidota bacterium]